MQYSCYFNPLIYLKKGEGGMSRLLHQAETLTQYVLVPTFTVSLSLLCCFLFGNKIFDINHELFFKLSSSPQIFCWQC